MSEQREIRKLAEAVRLLFTAVDRMNWRLGVLADRLPPLKVVDEPAPAPEPEPTAPPADASEVPEFVRGDEPHGAEKSSTSPTVDPLHGWTPEGEDVERFRPKRKIYAPELVADVCRRWAAGERSCAIAEALGLDAKAVENIAFRHGAKRPKRVSEQAPPRDEEVMARARAIAAPRREEVPAPPPRAARVVTEAIVDPARRAVAVHAVEAETAPADADTILAWGRRNGAAFGALTAEALASINLARSQHQLTPFRLIANPIGRLAPAELDRMANAAQVPPIGRALRDVGGPAPR